MARRSRSSSVLTMAEIVAEQHALPKAVDPDLVRPGTLNKEGNLCDPEGNVLTELFGELTEADALEAVRDGALVAFEGCGCGGGGGCTAQWFSDEQLRALLDPPCHGPKGDEPSWISFWEGPVRNVVFVHGSYSWLGLF